MPYLRREKLSQPRKKVEGDHKIGQSQGANKTPESTVSDIALIESIYDDEVRINLLEIAEGKLAELEEMAADALADINILVDPDKNFPLVKALSTLKGEPTLVLDGDIVQMAADLGMDGYIHMNGFDPVAAMLGLHGGDDKPNVPVPRLFMDCEEMAALGNVPSTEDSDYQTASVEDVHVEVEQAKAMDIYTKLWKLFKYFPGVDIRSFLKKIRNRWTKRPVNRAIRWVECRMINPGLFLLTGEARSCKPGDDADDPPDPGEIYNLTDEDLEGTGLDCMEAAGMVTAYMHRNMENDKGVKLMYRAMEERAMHEAKKFGQLSVNIKNKERFKDRMENLNKFTKDNPRYKKRFYDHKDTFVKAVENDNIKMKAEIF